MMEFLPRLRVMFRGEDPEVPRGGTSMGQCVSGSVSSVLGNKFLRAESLEVFANQKNVWGETCLDFAEASGRLKVQEVTMCQMKGSDSMGLVKIQGGSKA